MAELTPEQMEFEEELTQGLIDAGDDLYLDDQGNWQTTTDWGEEEEGQWVWGDEGLQPLGGQTTHEITPFLDIKEEYRGGNPIEADTWEDAARRSIEGFMRAQYINPVGAPEDPAIMWSEKVATDPSSMFRIGTLQDLIQDETIPGVFFDTGDAEDRMFLTDHQIDVGLTDSGNLMRFRMGRGGGLFGLGGQQGPRVSYHGDVMSAGIRAGEPITPEQYNMLHPETKEYLSWLFGFRPPGTGRIDPLMGLSPSDKLIAFNAVPAEIGAQLEEMFGPPVPGWATSEGDFNDYLFKLDLNRFAPPPELIRATPESVLRKFFDLPQYQLAFGQDADQLDPTERFRADPGYQFIQDEGMRNVQRNAAARGLLESGRTMRDLTQFGQNLADQNYQRWLGQQAGMYGDWQNQLRGLASMGAGLSQQAGQQAMATGGQQAGLNAQLASNLGSLFGNQGSMGSQAFLTTGQQQAATTMQAAALEAQVLEANQRNATQQMAGVGSLLGGIGSFF